MFRSPVQGMPQDENAAPPAAASLAEMDPNQFRASLVNGALVMESRTASAGKQAALPRTLSEAEQKDQEIRKLKMQLRKAEEIQAAAAVAAPAPVPAPRRESVAPASRRESVAPASRRESVGPRRQSVAPNARDASKSRAARGAPPRPSPRLATHRRPTWRAPRSMACGFATAVSPPPPLLSPPPTAFCLAFRCSTNVLQQGGAS